MEGCWWILKMRKMNMKWHGTKVNREDNQEKKERERKRTMRFKTFATICYRFPIKSAVTRVLPPESTEERRRREIAKMEEHQEFTDGLKESVQMTRNGRWQEVADWQNWMQERDQRGNIQERVYLFGEVWLSLKWLNLWGENRKDRSKVRWEL